jgi:hypothetical protein
MNKILILFFAILSFSQASIAESVPSSEIIDHIYESEDFRQKLADLQYAGYALIKLEDLMEPSKFEIKAKTTQNVDVDFNISPSDNKICDSVHVYDSFGMNHKQNFCILQSKPNEWEWALEKNRGQLNSSGLTTVQIFLEPLGTSVNFNFRLKTDPLFKSSHTKIIQDGYTNGTFAGWSAGPDSNHRNVIYSNGESRIIEFKKQ